MRNVLIVLFSVIVVAAFEGVRQLYRWSVDRRLDELRRRLQAIGREEAGPSTVLLRQETYAANPGLAAVVRGLPFAGGIQRLLQQTDSRLTVAQVYGYSALGAAAGFVAAALLRAGGGLALLFSVAGLSVPVLSLRVARARRSGKLSEQMPEALDMMARSLRAGHAFTTAFEVVAREMPHPVAIEFGRAFETQRLGVPVEQSIVQMAERVPGNRDVRIFAVSAVIQRETGGNLSEVLSNIAETIRARYRFYGKLRALTAEGRASGLILGSLPIGMTLLLRIMNPEYLVPLVTTSGGRAILMVGLGLWTFGGLWLYSLTKVDV